MTDMYFAFIFILDLVKYESFGWLHLCYAGRV
jgi:hypothetical protein